MSLGCNDENRAIETSYLTLAYVHDLGEGARKWRWGSDSQCLGTFATPSLTSKLEERVKKL